MVAVHLAGAVDGAVIQRRPAQVVLAAAEFLGPGIMGCASVEWVVVILASWMSWPLPAHIAILLSLPPPVDR